MSKKEHGLISNAVFVLRFAFDINKKVFFVKIPQILVLSATPFIAIVLTRYILNELTTDKDPRKLLLYVLLLGGLSLLAKVISLFLDYLSEQQMMITVQLLKKRLGEIVMGMPFSEVEQPRTRDFINLAKEDTGFAVILSQISNILTSLLTIVGLFALMLSIHPLSLLLILIVASLRVLTDTSKRKVFGKWRPFLTLAGRKSGYTARLMTELRYGKEIRVNSLGSWIEEKAKVNLKEYLKTSTRFNMDLQRREICITIALIVQEFAIYALLAYQVFFHGMPIGDFSMYLSAVVTISGSIMAIVGSFSSFLETGLFAKEFRYCADSYQAHTKNNPPGKNIKDLDKNKICIEFQNVSFQYPSSDKMVLKDISITLCSGKSLSLVGMNGAGKTTFVKLICRFYTPTKGKIRLNGIDIQEIDYDLYMDLIGVVFQDFKTLAFSVKENIAFQASGDAKDDEILDSLEKSGLSSKIASLDKGILTSVSKEFDENGIAFSGGEDQKLAIARTLYKNAPILILDEPTTALDPIAEYELYRKFNELLQGKLTIFISHRLSSCSFCDNIAVFDGGCIAEYGTHEQLMASDGKYCEWWSLQAQYYV